MRYGWSEGGGVYESKAVTIERIKSTIRDVLPKVFPIGTEQL